MIRQASFHCHILLFFILSCNPKWVGTQNGYWGLKILAIQIDPKLQVQSVCFRQTGDRVRGRNLFIIKNKNKMKENTIHTFDGSIITLHLHVLIIHVLIKERKRQIDVGVIKLMLCMHEIMDEIMFLIKERKRQRYSMMLSLASVNLFCLLFSVHISHTTFLLNNCM